MQSEAFLTLKDAADLLNCSPRHVRRLSEREAMPPPVRLGALVRWRRADIEQWIEAGCPCVSELREGGEQ